MYIWLSRIFCKWSYFKSFPERSVKKKKQNENEKNFWNNLALTSCLSDTIWFSSQFFQHFFSTLCLSVISNLISFFSFFFLFISSHNCTNISRFRGIFPRNIISTVKFQLLFFRQPCPAQDNQSLYPAYIEIRERNNISSVPLFAYYENSRLRFEQFVPISRTDGDF